MTRVPLRVAAAILVAGFVGLLPVVLRLHDTAPPQDEGELLAYPQRVLAGDIPHRDFQTVYGPAPLWVLASAYAVTGVDMRVERAVGLALRVMITLSAGWLALRRGVAVAAGAAALCGMSLSAVAPMALAWFHGLAGLVLMTAALTSAARAPRPPAIGRGVVAGLAAAFALSARPELVVPVLLIAAALWCALDGRTRRALGLSLLLGLVPLGAHLLVASPARVFDNCVLAPLRIGPARWLPLLDYGGPSRNILLAALLLGTLLVGLAGLRRVAAAPRDPDARAALASGLLVFSLLPYALQRADLVHLRDVGCVTLALVPAALGDLCGSTATARSRLLERVGLAAVGAGTVALLATEEQRFLRLAPSPETLVHAGCTAFVDSPTAPELRALLDWVDGHVPPGSRLFVGPSDLSRTVYADTLLYALLPACPPAGYRLEMNPGDANRDDSGLAEDLARADVIVLSSAYDGWSEPNASQREGSPRPAQVVNERFASAAGFGPWEVFLRRPDAAPARSNGGK